jgi:hypothetical protein
VLGTGKINGTKNNIDELEPLDEIIENKEIGFNHIKNTSSNIMDNIIYHQADSRGHADHGWLKSRHTFSFANYYNPERMHFGVLRVLNDDIVAPSMGFGTHAHDNMEIISIPLKGDLRHRDSMGNEAIIRQGDIQVMSAGSGITHSEFNHKKNENVEFLQIWIFPNQRNVSPRYDQITLNNRDRKNKLQQILSPYPEDEGVWIHQDAWFFMVNLDGGASATHAIKRDGNGVYIFVINGTFEINGQVINARDGYGVWNAKDITINSLKDNSEILLMDVPMKMG